MPPSSMHKENKRGEKNTKRKRPLCRTELSADAGHEELDKQKLKQRKKSFMPAFALASP